MIYLVSSHHWLCAIFPKPKEDILALWKLTTILPLNLAIRNWNSDEGVNTTDFKLGTASVKAL